MDIKLRHNLKSLINFLSRLKPLPYTLSIFRGIDPFCFYLKFFSWIHFSSTALGLFLQDDTNRRTINFVFQPQECIVNFSVSVLAVCKCDSTWSSSLCFKNSSYLYGLTYVLEKAFLHFSHMKIKREKNLNVLFLLYFKYRGQGTEVRQIPVAQWRW